MLKFVDVSDDHVFPCEDVLYRRVAAIPGAPILECTPSTICDYACGAFELCQRDVNLVLGQSANTVLTLLASIGLPQAFRLRNEMCNLKKCTFFVLQQAHTIERQLAQLATFWHGEHTMCAGGFWLHSPRLEELSDARTRAKGACAAVQDARAVAKHVCSLPRHPSTGPPKFVSSLPSSLQSWRIAVAAEAAADAAMVTNSSAAAAAAECAAVAVAAGASEADEEQTGAQAGLLSDTGGSGMSRRARSRNTTDRRSDPTAVDTSDRGTRGGTIRSACRSSA